MPDEVHNNEESIIDHECNNDVLCEFFPETADSLFFFAGRENINGA
jgi:hypothetical protein